MKTHSPFTILHSPRKGFTLIEILVVVAIIGILASIVIVGVGTVQRQGRDARRIADLEHIETALELYYNKYRVYPGSSAGGAGGNCGSTDNVSGADWQANLVTCLTTQTGLVTALPDDPSKDASTPKHYYYKSCNGGKDYTLGAKLDDPKNPAIGRGLQASEDTCSSVSWGVSCGDTTLGIYCVRVQ